MRIPCLVGELNPWFEVVSQPCQNTMDSRKMPRNPSGRFSAAVS